MESNPATRAIGQMAFAFAAGDLLLALLITFDPPAESNITAILVGTMIGQFGLGCAAILRNEMLYEAAVGWLVLLVSSSGLVPVVFNKADAAGYVLLFALIIAGVSLAMNLLPCVALRSMTSHRGFQFSIMHIMLLMTLVGVSIVITSMTYLFVLSMGLFLLSALGFALFLLVPSAIGSLLIGTLSKKKAFVVSMALMAGLIGAGWTVAPQGEQIWLYLLTQTITVMLGGYVLMLVELGASSNAASSSAATASQLRSEIAPDPLDEP